MAKRKNPAAVALGRKGGKKGGKARAANLTPEQLAEIGRMGAAARWAKQGRAKGQAAE
jgi:general stress protein YciG